MGIFKRMKRIARADINGLLDNIEEPIAMLNEYAREMDEEIVKAERALARQLFVENKQAALILEVEALVEKRTRQAGLAIDQGEETIAKLALQEKLTHEKQLNLYEQQYEAIKEQTEILKAKLTELRQSYEELQHKKILLASRANVARSIKQIQQAAGSQASDDILRGVARVEDRILMMEAEVQAGTQLNHPKISSDSLFVTEEELNRELAKLKENKSL